MLKNISPVLFPKLLKILCEMGYGDTIVFAVTNFSSHILAPQVIRADRIKTLELL